MRHGTTILGVFLCVGVCCFGRTITVALDGSGEFTTIQAAINVATHGDVVLVADGVYKGAGNRDIEFKGKAITVKSANGPEKCIVDCQGSGTDVRRGFCFQGYEGLSSILDGFTIVNAFWGAIYCDGAGPTIRNCDIRNSEGAIMLKGNRETVIEHCIIERNQGAGISRDSSSFGAELIVRYCQIKQNSTGIDGRGTVRVQFCDIVDNRGTGISLSLVREYVISRCRISNNQGRGIYTYGCSGVINQCEIESNKAGGVYAYGGSYHKCVVRNTVLQDNAATRGGAIGSQAWGHGLGVELHVINCLLVGNMAAYGGGLHVGGGSVAYVHNSILWDNTALMGNATYVNTSPGQLTIAHCNVQGARQAAYVGAGAVLNWGEGNIDEDPLFAFESDFRLLPGSPCIDAGTNTPPEGLTNLDFDYSLRVKDGNGDGKAIVDMGPYEFSSDQPCIALSHTSVDVFAEKGSSTPAEVTISLRNAGGAALNWRAMEECDWLEILPEEGTCLMGVQELQVRADPSGLAHGRYVHTLEIVDEQAVNSPRKVRVGFHVHSTIRIPQDANSIQVAIDMAVDGDTIIVADGVYTGGNNRNISLRGKAITLRSKNGPKNCIIDGEGKYNLFYIAGPEGSSSIVDGFTIRNGYHDSGYAGVVVGSGNSMTIQNCVIENCKSGPPNPFHRGPAILCEVGTRIVNCVVKNNMNGGILCMGTHIEGCTIKNNTGRGIVISRHGGTIIDCLITGNQGGIRIGETGLFLPDVVIDRCNISGNRLPENVDSGYGAGILCSTAMDNLKVILSNSIISGNVAADSGGGVYVWGYELIVDGCTIADNRAANTGGGLFFNSRSQGMVSNSIICDNVSATGGQLALFGDGEPSRVAVAYSAIQVTPANISVTGGGTLAFEDGIIEDDPLISANGYWDPNDIWIEGDYRLRWGSRCIDGGDPARAYDSSRDVEGNARVIGQTSDVGAHEFVYFGDIAPDGQFALSDFAVVSGQWLSTGCGEPDWCRGADLDSNGAVGTDDLALMLDYWLAGGDIRAEASRDAIAYWTFDEVGGADAFDLSGNGHTAQLMNMADVNRVAGMHGGALQFNGQGEYVEVPGFEGVTGSRERAVSVWIKTTSRDGEIISWGVDGVPGGRWTFLVQKDGFLRLEVGAGAVVGSTKVNDGQWHHVAVVLNGRLTDTISLFVDGEPDVPSILVCQVVKTVSGQNVRIGGVESTGRYFKGTVDELRVYERALSIVDVRTLAGIRQSAIAHWRFDDAAGVIAADAGEFGRDGVLVNMGEEAWGDGRVGGGLCFDGVDDYVRIDGWKGIGGGRSRTVCAWIKTLDSEGVIVGWGPEDVAGGRWVFLVEGGGRLRLEVGGGAMVGTAVAADGEWHHVAAVLDNDGTPNVNEVRLYVDGVLDAASSAGDRTVDTMVWGASPEVGIGAWPGAGRCFEGVMDEVRVYERALSAEEVGVLAGQQ